MVGNVAPLAAAAAKSSGFNPSTLILILIVVVAFYLLMIRPQQRRRQQAQQQQNTVQPGATVRTTAGMYATVVDIDGDDVILEVAPGVEARFMRRAIMDVVSPAEPADEEETAADDDADTGFEHDAEESDVHDAEETADTPSASAEGAEDAEDAAYEQATGTKKD